MSNEKSYTDHDIFDRLKMVRKTHGLSQAVFAAAIGLKQNSYSDIESGKREPPQPIILTICYRFQINEEWLKTGKGEMTARPEGLFERLEEYKIERDPDLAEIVDILINDLPEAKTLVLKLLRGRKESKEALEGFKEPLKEG